MINDKIGKIISELYKVQDILLPLAKNKDNVVISARKAISNICIKLAGVMDDIEVEKAIDNCRVRQMEMSDDGTGDCGVEDGMCLGYKDDDGMFEQCRACEYSMICEEEKI